MPSTISTVAAAAVVIAAVGESILAIDLRGVVVVQPRKRALNLTFQLLAVPSETAPSKRENETTVKRAMVSDSIRPRSRYWVNLVVVVVGRLAITSIFGPSHRRELGSDAAFSGRPGIRLRFAFQPE